MHEQRILSVANDTTGVLHSASLAISAIGAGLAGIRGLVPKHATKQVDRLLSNPKLDLDSLANTWVPGLLANRAEAVLAIDWTDFDADGQTTLALNLITNHGQAAMLLWKTVRKSDPAGKRNDIEDALLEQLAGIIRYHLSHKIRIAVICDRGFADHKFFQWITDHGFDFVIRLKQGTRAAEPNGDSKKAQDWVPSNGRADALLIVCVPSDEPLPRGDLLTSRALSGFPAGWLAVPRLREVGLLPPAIGARSLARQRAIALRERRFPCDIIARWLDAEGYAAPNTDPGHWTRSDVIKLLCEARSIQPATLPDASKGTPATWL